MASPQLPPCYATDRNALDDVLANIKHIACSHCRRSGALIGHGCLRGYAERGSETVVRGRRFFCSNRGRRPGCGRTFSVKLETVVSGFVVRTLTLWRFVQAVLGGLTRRGGWLREARGALSLSNAYRLWQRFGAAQSGLRSRLSREAPAPACNVREPLAQLIAHLMAVVGSGQVDPFATYQHRMQHGLFDQ